MNVFYNDGSDYVKYGSGLKPLEVNIDDYLTKDLNRFHTYSVIWNETDLIWLFDNEVTNQINLTDTKLFLSEPIIFSFFLRVGGHPYRGAGPPTVDEVRDWNCSLFVLDYVRYYRWKRGIEPTKPKQIEQDRSDVSFCKKIMNEIRPKKFDQGGGVNVIAIVAVLSLILLLILIPLVIWLVLRIKKMRDPARQSSQVVQYYDDIDHVEFYDTVDFKGDQYQEYCEQYQDVQRKSNLYTDPESPKQKLSKTMSATNDHEDDYITMMAKWIIKE